MNQARKPVHSMPIAKIKVGTRLRFLNRTHVQALAESMDTIGLVEPVVVTRYGHLVSGCHRVEAAKKRGWKSIPTIVLDLDDTRAALAEIDENLIRKELTDFERGKYTARRKEALLHV